MSELDMDSGNQARTPLTMEQAENYVLAQEILGQHIAVLSRNLGRLTTTDVELREIYSTIRQSYLTLRAGLDPRDEVTVAGILTWEKRVI